MSDDGITLAAVADAVAVDPAPLPSPPIAILPDPEPVVVIDAGAPYRAQLADLTRTIEGLRVELACVTEMLDRACSGELGADIAAWWKERKTAYEARMADLKTATLARLSDAEKRALGLGV